KFSFSNSEILLLCLISVSLSEFVIVEVQHGGEVSLLCSNLSRFVTNVFWFKMDQRSNATKITSMMRAESNATVKEGFKNGRFQMSSNSNHVSLNIRKVNFSDSGLYFCGLYKNSDAVIFDATYLQVEAEIVSFFPVSQIKGIYSLHCKKIYHLHSCLQILEPDALNYAALTFQQNRRGPTSETELDQNRSG
uniref:Ig-like domain-containing protein n=1 Tax=Oryzias melastigma TaxID=30732 RepID=A0A3B3CFZ5_ORYME